MKITKNSAVYLALILAITAAFPTYAADIKAGEKKAEQCAGCHGAKGISSSGQHPNLAGQQAAYLSHQLTLFKEGTRVNPMMQGMAGGLSAADIENLAAYFASLPNTYVKTDVKVPAEAAAKYAMCAGCHGAAGEGRSGFPRLANQQADYLVTQLHAFKKGERKGGPMPSIATGLTEEDIKNLSVYLASLKAKKE